MHLSDTASHAPAPETGTRWTVAVLTAVFASLAAAAYAASDIVPSPIVELFLTSAPLLAVLLWLQQDARRTGTGAVLDWGYFLLLAWPVVIPWYAFTTRGAAGWRLVVVLFGLILSAYLSGGAVVLLRTFGV